MTIKLPPLEKYDHPDRMTRWTDTELAAIKSYATAAVELAEARHMEELNAYALTVSNLRADLERECIRLAACGVVAMSDTPESVAKARAMLPEYRSASCDDVARLVDECIALRAEIAGFEAGCAEDSQIGIRMRQEMIDLKVDRDRLRAQLAQSGAKSVDLLNLVAKLRTLTLNPQDDVFIRRAADQLACIAQPTPVQHGGPVAWVTSESVNRFGSDRGRVTALLNEDGDWCVPLYAAPQPAPVQPDLSGQGEPYGWAVSGDSSIRRGEFAAVDAKSEARLCGGTARAFPLYTAPQPAPTVQPELTDAEIDAVYFQSKSQHLRGQDPHLITSFARAVIAAHEAKRGAA